jgi:phosphoglycerate dehydrogenase-like enzyme
MKLCLLAFDRDSPSKFPAWFRERLAAEFPQIAIARPELPSEEEREIRDAEIAAVTSLRRETFLAARQLNWIHSFSTGVDGLLFPELAASRITLTNASPVHSPVVAEHVMALLFSLARRLPQASRLQLGHLWGQKAIWDTRPRPRELAGAVVGLVGLGGIGRAVAKSAHALGMQVLAARSRAEEAKPAEVDEVFSSSQLEKLLPRCDFVVLSVPLTDRTRGLMNASRLAAMKPDAYLINVGRGGLIDEDALVRALREEKIGGAALDVFVEEPLPEASPFWDLENLLVTPHTAGLSEKQWERQYSLLAENLGHYLAGEPLRAVVDKNRRY